MCNMCGATKTLTTLTRIIGIDPGSRKTGFGIIEWDAGARKLRHLAHGVLRLDVERDIGARMAELASRLKAVAELHQPTHCAVEDIFVSEGLRSALMLGQARGAVLATMGLLAIPVQHYAPTQVKLALTGAGRAQKAQVSEMVRLMLALSEKPAEDAGDALAIAICCAQQRAPLATLAQSTRAPTRMSTKAKRDALAALANAQVKARRAVQKD